MRTLLAARRHPWLMVTSVIVGLGVALVALFVAPRVYQSSVVVNVATSPAIAATDLFGSANFAQSRAVTYVGLVDSEGFAAEVAAAAGLPDEPAITAASQGETSLITLTASAGDPEQAQQAATVATELLTARAQTLDIGPDGGPALLLTVVEAAAVPESPVQPVSWIFMVVGLAGGIAAGLVLLTLRVRSDNRISQPSDLVDLNDSTGAVFWLPDERWNGSASGPRHEEYAERLAAVHQEFVAMPGRENRILLIAAPTGPHAETAHQVADDLSTTLVRGGRRVVVLRLQGDEQREHRPGLSDVLVGSHSTAQVTFRDLAGRLDIGPGQQVLRLLTATEREIRLVMSQVLAMADFVVIDAPPLSSPVGFPVMSQVADAVLVTATPKDLRTDDLVTARSIVDRLRVRYLGLLLAPRAPLPVEVRPRHNVTSSRASASAPDSTTGASTPQAGADRRVSAPQGGRDGIARSRE